MCSNHLRWKKVVGSNPLTATCLSKSIFLVGAEGEQQKYLQVVNDVKVVDNAPKSFATL